jgi:hypothetical protein
MISASGSRQNSEYSLCRGGDWVHGVGAGDGARAGLRQAEVCDLTRSDELGDGAGDIFDRHLRVDVVLVQQIDTVDAETLQRPLNRLLDVFGPAGQSGLLALLVEGEPELGGDDDVLADRREGFTDQLFVDERPVDLGGVEQCDSAIDRRP